MWIEKSDRTTATARVAVVARATGSSGVQVVLCHSATAGGRGTDCAALCLDRTRRQQVMDQARPPHRSCALPGVEQSPPPNEILRAAFVEMPRPASRERCNSDLAGLVHRKRQRNFLLMPTPTRRQRR